MMTSSNGNIFRVTGTVEWTIVRLVIWEWDIHLMIMSFPRVFNIVWPSNAEQRHGTCPVTCLSPNHDNDIIMTTMASQITILTIIYSTVYSGAYQRKHQSSASLAFVRGIHRRPVNSPHKWPVTQKMFPFDDVIMSLPGPRLMYCQLEQLRTRSFDFFYQNTIIFIHGYVFKHVCKMLAVLFYPQCDSISNENPGDRPTKAYEVTIQRYHKPHTDKSQ